MYIQFVEPSDRAQRRRIYQAGYWREHERRRQIRIQSNVLSGVAALFVVVTLSSIPDLPRWSTYGIVALAAATWTICEDAVARAHREPSRPLLPIAAVITEFDVSFNTTELRQSYAWTAVARVEEHDGMWIARGHWRDEPVFVIPPEYLTPEQVAEFRTFLATRWHVQADS